jgi:hypothetical protein
MGRKKVYGMVAGLAAIAAIALLLVFVVIPGSSTGNESAAIATDGSPSEGIAVHGHWTVDVLNADGSLAEHREFENSIVAGGQETFANILARLATVGRWTINIDSSTARPCHNDGSTYGCELYEVNYARTPEYGFDTLTVTRTGMGVLAKLILSGTAVIPNTSNISIVNTYLDYCDPNISAAECASTANKWGRFVITMATVSPPIAVQAGQQVQVTVAISFG